MAKKTELHTYILLDRSGSMANKWEEAIGAINVFIKSQKDNKEFNNYVTVAAFDSNGVGLGWNPNKQWQTSNMITNDTLSFDILRENVNVDDCVLLNEKETSPRGGTPLYDATAKLLDLAVKKSSKYTSIVIMTDGYENTSRHWTHAAIKSRLAEYQTQYNWQIIFLGAEFNVEHQAQTVGIDVSRTASVARGRMNDAVSLYSSKMSDYVMNNAQVSYSVDERAFLNTELPKEKE